MICCPTEQNVPVIVLGIAVQESQQLIYPLVWFSPRELVFQREKERKKSLCQKAKHIIVQIKTFPCSFKHFKLKGGFTVVTMVVIVKELHFC